MIKLFSRYFPIKICFTISVFFICINCEWDSYWLHVRQSRNELKLSIVYYIIHLSFSVIILTFIIYTIVWKTLWMQPFHASRYMHHFVIFGSCVQLCENLAIKRNEPSRFVYRGGICFVIWLRFRSKYTS